MVKLDAGFHELKQTVSKQHNVIDSVVSPLLFLLVNLWQGLQAAIWVSLIAAIAIVAWRLLNKQDVQFAFSGVFGTVLAIWLANRFGKAQGYFYPGIVAAGLTAVIAWISVVIRKPLIAYISKAAHDWPIEWYWHKQVQPAYTRVTVLWGSYFALKAAVQYWLVLGDDIVLLTTVKIVMGWPATIALLVISYVLGRWTLQQLAGPSVEEFRAKQPEPWQGQQHGF